MCFLRCYEITRFEFYIRRYGHDIIHNLRLQYNTYIIILYCVREADRSSILSNENEREERSKESNDVPINIFLEYTKLNNP